MASLANAEPVVVDTREDSNNSSREGEEHSYEEDVMPEEEQAWLRKQVSSEVAMMKTHGVSGIPLRVRNCGVVREERRDKQPLVVNRAECATAFDFSLVAQLMHSSPISFPFRAGFCYCTVLLFRAGDTEHPLVLPYVFPTQVQSDGKRYVKNSLREWLLINTAGARARHSIDSYVDL